MLARIEDAITRRIKDAKLPYLRTLATYGGELDGDIARVVRTFPAVWVAFKGEGDPTPVGTSQSRWVVPATWVVLVAARNLRSEESTRKGDAHCVGTYQMLEDIRSLLLGQDFAPWGLEIDPLKPGRIRSLYNGRLQSDGISIYAQEWHTRYTLTLPVPHLAASNSPGNGSGPVDPNQPLPLPGTPLPDCTDIGLNYHLQPDDGTADATDLITMQERS